MNLKSLEYFVEVSKDLNMTSAAQRLYISQQALSLQIQKLENYYGVALFERQPKLQLTYAGERLLKSARKILQEDLDLRNTLSDISLQMVLPEFSKKWPNISFQLIERPIATMLEMINNRELDVAVGAPSKAEIQHYSEKLEFTFLIDEPTYLICSDQLLERYYGDEAEAIKAKCANGTDLKDFSKLPFILHQPPMMLRKTADDCFHRAGFKPKIYLEAANSDLNVSLYPCHQGAFFCRKAKLPTLTNLFPDCNIFPVKHNDEEYKLPIYMMRRKNPKPPVHCLEFEELMKEAWRIIDSY